MACDATSPEVFSGVAIGVTLPPSLSASEASKQLAALNDDAAGRAVLLSTLNYDAEQVGALCKSSKAVVLWCCAAKGHEWFTSCDKRACRLTARRVKPACGPTDHRSRFIFIRRCKAHVDGRAFRYAG